jgi:hypothetical protein
VSFLPYLVAVGNHELNNRRSVVALENAARFLAPLDPQLSAQRFHYATEIGPVAFYFLDSNILVYGEDGARDEVAGDYTEGPFLQQLKWLQGEVVTLSDEKTMVVSIHHPFIQSSKKHRKSARGLWNATFEGKTLPQWLVDMGVDVVFTGHTHTYERFRLEREGSVLHVVNTSGRPRTNFLWMGDGARRSRDIQGRELEWLGDKGFEKLDGWRIEQVDAMVEDHANQFGIVTVGSDGGDVRTSASVRLE